jgi:hypothetical protein
MAYATTSASLPDRMLRAARLNVQVYEEVEADTTATTQALLVVVLVALAQGIGGALGATMSNAPGANPIGSLIGGVVGGLIGWAIWSFVIFFVGTRIFGGTATYGELLRTLGFAEAPLIINILGFIPVLGGIIGLVAFIWALVTGFIATRQALDLSNGKTVGTIVVAICVLILVFVVLGVVFGGIFALGMLAGGTARP